MTQESAATLSLTTSSADTSMVFWMRLLLAVSAILTLFVVPDAEHPFGRLTWLIFFAYTLHSGALYILSRLEQPFWHGKVVYWLDICWYALMVYSSGGGNSYYVPFFYFAILAAAFQWGFDEGARITLASTALLGAAVLLASDGPLDHSRLLLRATFVLGLGYMISFWGGLGVSQRRRLALLRDVSSLANPRFGVDHTLASVLAKTCAFFNASSCILLMRDTASDGWLLRTARAPGHGPAFVTARISGAAAAPLLAFSPQQIVLHVQTLNRRLRPVGDTRALERDAAAADTARWLALDGSAGDELADLLDAGAFISAPLQLRKGEGRIYVVAPHGAGGFVRGDALFLSHIAAQVFPVIENIALLDRLASDAAFRERQKIGRDLHDTTIQPYIGLRHGLSALRHAAGPDNPLNDELDKLIDMSTHVIGDMRQFAKNFQKAPQSSEPELLVALRRQAQQVQQFYGITIDIECDGVLEVNDRLAAEVFQIVNEGMSNIRKHTLARHGSVRLRRDGGALKIAIDNDNPGAAAAEFLPGSIAERCAALGGSVRVERNAGARTAVHVSIPV